MAKLALRGYITNFFLVSRLYSVLTIKITQGMKNVCVSDTFEIFVNWQFWLKGHKY